MPKLEKGKLEQLTVDAVRMAGTVMSMLVMTRCPIRQEYEQVESFLQEVDEIRKDLGLEPVGQEEMLHGKRAQRRPIGFELPEGVC